MTSQLSTEHQLRLRPVIASDIPYLYQVYCDPVVRQNSRITASPSVPAFQQWVQTQPHMYTIVWRGILVGYARITPLPIGVPQVQQTIGEISYALAYDARGRGWGTDIIRLLNWEGWALGYRELMAEVKPENMASIQVLLKSGYTICLPPGHQYLLLTTKKEKGTL